MCKNLHELFLGNWFDGPKYLRELSINVFPFQFDDKLKLVDAFAECKTKCNTFSDLSSYDIMVVTCASEHVNFTETTGPIRTDCQSLSLSKVLDDERFSSLKKLLMTLAYIRRFVHNIRMIVKKKNELLCTDVITAEELEQSLIVLI